MAHDAAREVKLDSVAVFNVTLDRPNELAERISLLLNHPDRAVEMGQAGQNRWKGHLRYRCFRERFPPVLRDFLEGTA